MKKIKHLGVWSLALALLSASSCSDDNNNGNGGDAGTQKFYIAATNGDYTYSLAADDVSTGTLSLQGNGIESLYSFTSFIFNGTKSVTAMQYRQGDPSIGMSFRLNSSGQLETFSNEFQLQKGFTTFGTMGNYAVAARSGQALSDGVSTGAVVYFIDQENNNNVSTKELNTLGLNDNVTFDDGTGNQVKESGTLCGVVDRGNGTFLTSAVFSHGVTSGGGSSTATVGNPDECWVLELDQNLNVIRKFSDDRISYSAGRYRSQYYSQIANDTDGNTYVFSGAYENRSTKNAGVLRIPNGGSDFDSYYWDLEAASGGYRFRKVWHLTNDTFLLEFYNEQYETLNVSSVATQYAIVKMESKTFNWLTTGFPSKDTIVSTGWPYAYEGKMYFPVTVADQQPAIYIIDPATLSATRGLEVNGAENISALSVLKAN